MSAFNLLFPLAILVIGLCVTAAIVRGVRTRRRAARRVVEQPNSHYVSHWVQEAETRHRWHGIQLDQVHEINRGEVARLLMKVETGGTETLRENERTFLDYMTELSRKSSAAEPAPEEAPPVTPELRHRPA